VHDLQRPAGGRTRARDGLRDAIERADGQATGWAGAHREQVALLQPRQDRARRQPVDRGAERAGNIHLLLPFPAADTVHDAVAPQNHPEMPGGGQMRVHAPVTQQDPPPARCLDRDHAGDEEPRLAHRIPPEFRHKPGAREPRLGREGIEVTVMRGPRWRCGRRR
jgi:hypothetical protein